VSTPYSATREASKSDRNSSYNWGGTAHRRPHTSFLCEDFFYGEAILWKSNDGDAW